MLSTVCNNILYFRNEGEVTISGEGEMELYIHWKILSFVNKLIGSCASRKYEIGLL